MRTAKRKVPARLRTRTCLSCGYDGPSLQGERGRTTFLCPCCGQDLYARPPLSYAEMEGLKVKRRLRLTLRRQHPSRPRRRKRVHPIQRLLALFTRLIRRR